jgi:hypothetical protein
MPKPRLATLLVLLGLFACATPTQAPPVAPAPPVAESAPPAPPPPPPAPPPVVPVPFDEAVAKAANALFSGAKVAPDARRVVLIDPLIDGMTGEQTQATRTMESRITQIVHERYPQFDVQPFSVDNLKKSPLILVGTFTGVNKDGKTEGSREAFRICLALADLDNRVLVGKGTARAKPENVDLTPLPYFRDSPAWGLDPVTEGYIKTCQASKPGDPMDPLYVARVVSAASVQQAIAAYNAGRYRESLNYYAVAMRAAAGDELRILNGVYLANIKLGQKHAAQLVFGRIVDFGLGRKRLAVKFLFKPGSTAFWPDPKVSGIYPVWIKEIAAHSEQQQACLEIIGHTSHSGPEPLNERISLLRAELIKTKLETDAPALRARTIANGVGSRENLIGNGQDNVTDLLDRRVSFRVIDCAAKTG